MNCVYGEWAVNMCQRTGNEGKPEISATEGELF